MSTASKEITQAIPPHLIRIRVSRSQAIGARSMVKMAQCEANNSTHFEERPNTRDWEGRCFSFGFQRLRPTIKRSSKTTSQNHFGREELSFVLIELCLSHVTPLREQPRDRVI